MMYPKNAASPPRIAIGAVVQISDGAVQTSGVSVVVCPEGGSESAGGGTVSYGASSGIVYYVPTQAETNYTAFVVSAYKTGCIPVSQTIVTTDSSTAGTAKLAPTTHTSAVIPTVSTLTGHTAQTGDAFARLGAPAGASVSADVAAVKAVLPAALVGGRIDANMGAISGDATAADNLEIAFDDTPGAVPWQGVVDQGTAQSATGTTLQLRSAAAFADDELIGAVIVITGGSAGVGQARVITDYVSSTDTATVDAWTTTPSGTITYKVLAAPPADGVAAAMKAVLDKLDTAMEVDGAVYRFTINALEQAPAGGGGGSTDWTADERTAIRSILGIPGSGTTPADPTTGILDTIRDAVGAVSTTIGSAGAGLTEAGGTGDHLTALPWNAAWDAEVQSECTDALNAYDPPTNAELTAALAAADDATLSAIAALVIPTATENADALLARDIGSGTGAGSLNERTVRSALRFLRNKWGVSGTTLTVTKEDDATTAWTGTVTASPGADPISGNDPT